MHTIAVGLLLDISEVHLFNDIGYMHDTVYNCPPQSVYQDSISSMHGRCACDEKEFEALGGLWNFGPATRQGEYVEFINREMAKRKQAEKDKDVKEAEAQRESKKKST
jgi:hypothetical protein